MAVRPSILVLACLVLANAIGPRPVGHAQSPPEIQSDRQVVLLDRDWRFALGDAADLDRDFGFGGSESYAKITSWRGPIRPGFNAAAWRRVDLPHDWAVETPFVQAPPSSELTSHGFKPIGRAFPATSIGWYRRSFSLSPEDKGKRISIEFDGVFRDAMVWLNGVLLGRHEGGYAPFGFDATDAVNDGADNVLVVRVDATQAEGWFYEGAGIYRHVWLVRTAPLHFQKWGIFVSSRMEAGEASIDLVATITNDSAAAVRPSFAWQIIGPDGTEAASGSRPSVEVAPWKSVEIKETARLRTPILWSLEKPALYRFVSIANDGPRVVDATTTRFGIRTIRFDPDKGFFLNGEHVLIKGMCCHQDHAGVGAAVPDRLQRYRIERLKEMGVNAYRSSHNPPAQEILDACDELGVLVMDETRLFSSSPLSIGHLDTLVRRDRNHPSVILWSIGNEEPEQATPRGHRVAESMIRTVKRLDTTRPVTYASNSGAYAGVNELVEVRGFNYYLGEVDRYHREHPSQPLVLSEVASTVSTRGEYADDKARGYLSAYDRHAPSWGELASEWLKFLDARPFLAGGFVWTGFDYRGEPTPYEWPCISSHFGILDTCGFKKDLFWYYKSWWTSEPVLHLFPHWNWTGRAGEPIEVWAFTNADEVRLSLNGKSLESRKVERLGRAEWRVPFEAGRLEAVGLRSGREIARTFVETTGAASTMRLEPDRSTISTDSRDVSVVNVSAFDSRGRKVPSAASDITFELEGPGRILGLGNGDPSSHEADRVAEVTVALPVTGWLAAPLDSEPAEAPRVTDLAARGSAKPARIDRDARAMPPNSTWAFWTTMQLNEEQLASGLRTLSIGQVDDSGTVYMNGTLIGKTRGWDQEFTFDVKSALRVGANDLVVVVKNDAGPGGIGRGVALFGLRPSPPLHRRLFNGLAQVLVQSTGAAGEITLTGRADGLPPATATIRAVADRQR